MRMTGNAVRTLQRLRTGAAFALLFLPAFSLAQETVALLYNHRPPYIVSQPDGSATGLTATPAANAFKAAGIPVEWKKMPTNRQIAAIKENVGNDCAIGWFKNPEREQFAKFTNPIYRDKPTVLLANRQFTVSAKETLRNLLGRRDIHVLVKERFSYGPYIDGLLAELKPLTVSTTGENIQMLEMIRAHRADFMFVAEEEASYLVEQAGFSSGDFKMIRPEDVPAGEKRYLICSKRVDDRIIMRLNAAIPTD